MWDCDLYSSDGSNYLINKKESIIEYAFEAAVYEKLDELVIVQKFDVR